MSEPLASLLILSHVTHSRHGDGLYAYGPYAREIEEWAKLFGQVVIATPCREEAPPGDAAAFAQSNIVVVPLPEFSGGGLFGRLRDVVTLPGCVLRLCRLLWQTDAVHVRCPGNIGLLGLLLAPAVFRVKRLLGRRRDGPLDLQTFRPSDSCSHPLNHRPRSMGHGPRITYHASRITHSLPLIAKYAGQWNGYPGEAWTYRLQRWLLKSRWWGAPVTVYGEWPHQPRHVIPFFTSVLTEEQMALARESAKRKAEIGRAESRECEEQSKNWESRKQKQSSAGGEYAEHGNGSAETEYQSPERSALGNGWAGNPVTLGRGGLRSGLVSPAATDVGAPDEAQGVVAGKATPSLPAAAACVPGSVGNFEPGFWVPDSGICVDSVLRVLYVGRLSAAKHVDTVIAAVAAARTEDLAVELTIAGDGPERERLEALAAEHDPALGPSTPSGSSPSFDITNHVSRFTSPVTRFTGGLPFDQVLDCYREHDVLVLASETEGWPKAIAEGMAFGLICIGSNRSIIPQMLGEGRGFLVEPGDRAALVACLQQIVAMPANERAEMSRRAAAWGQRYTLEHLREALRELMEKWWGLPPSTSGTPA